MLENCQNLKRHQHLEVYKSSRVWHQEKHASETVDELLQIWLDHLLFESQTQETLSAKGQWPSAFEEQIIVYSEPRLHHLTHLNSSK